VLEERNFCLPKGKFGLNCQAISDVCCRILDNLIVHSGAMSDFLAFKGSDIYQQLECGLLHDNLVLFGDNAYLNLHFMVMPFPNVSRGSKNDFNFFHSQLCIQVECAFGMMVSPWGISRTAIPQNNSLARTIALVHSLAKLHNLCIGKQDEKNSKDPVNIPETPLQDEDYMMTQCAEGYITMTADDSGVSLPAGLMNCWHHSDDLPRALHRTRSILENIEASGSTNKPCKLLHLQVIESQKTRPHEDAINHKYKFSYVFLLTMQSITKKSFPTSTLSPYPHMLPLDLSAGDWQIFLPGGVETLQFNSAFSCSCHLFLQLCYFPWMWVISQRHIVSLQLSFQ
jgi:hypothetical protein